MNILDVNNLSVSFFTERGVVKAVRDISFTVPKSKIVCIVGESGCGKSVTAKSLMGLIQEPGKISSESAVLYKGKNILKYDEDEWSNFRGNTCTMVFQDALTALNPTIKVGKQIAENYLIHHPDCSQCECNKRVIDILRRVGIHEPEKNKEKFPHELSGGMRQRVMIAMAMITEPEILIADEATTALDVTIQIQILDLMKEFREKYGTSIVLITHNFGVVAEVADYIMVMYAGKIMEKGEVNEIFYHTHHPYTHALLSSVPRIDARRDHKLEFIDGKPPSLIKQANGCPFFPRCSYAMKICQKQMPAETKINDKHSCFCWLEHPYSDTSDVPFLEEKHAQ